MWQIFCLHPDILGLPQSSDESMYYPCERIARLYLCVALYILEALLASFHSMLTQPLGVVMKRLRPGGLGNLSKVTEVVQVTELKGGSASFQ